LTFYALGDVVPGPTHAVIRAEEVSLAVEPSMSSVQNQFRGRIVEIVPAGALSRVTFEELASSTPLHAALHRARTLQHAIVVVGRSRRLAVEDHHAELRTLEGEHAAVRTDVRKTVGDVGTAFVMAGVDLNLLVMQAAGTHLD